MDRIGKRWFPGEGAWTASARYLEPSEPVAGLHRHEEWKKLSWALRQAGVDALSASVVDRASWYHRWPLKSVAESPPRLSQAASSSSSTSSTSAGGSLHAASGSSASAGAPAAAAAVSADEASATETDSPVPVTKNGVAGAPHLQPSYAIALSTSGAVGFTAVVMTYGSLARALNAQQKCKALSSSSSLVHECILLFNRGASRTSSSSSSSSSRGITDKRASGTTATSGSSDTITRLSSSAMASTTSDATVWEPPSDFMASVPRSRLVVAAINDLLNNFNTSILRPATDALLLLDDDNIPQAHLVLTALWRAWHDSLRGSVSGVGIPVGVKAINPPTRVEARVSHACAPRYRYGSAVSSAASLNPWVLLPSNLVLHRCLADAFLQTPALEPLRAFVRTHSVRRDDLAFGAFAGWYTGRPPLCLDPNRAHFPRDAPILPQSDRPPTIRGRSVMNRITSNARALLRKSQKHARKGSRRLLGQSVHLFNISDDFVEEEEDEREDETDEDDEANVEEGIVSEKGETSPRRRLGMAGQPAWHWLRSTAALWVLHYFEGYSRYACGDKCQEPGSLTSNQPIAATHEPVDSDTPAAAAEAAAAAAVGAAAAAHASARLPACWVDAKTPSLIPSLRAPSLAHRNHGLNCSRNGPPLWSRKDAHAFP